MTKYYKQQQLFVLSELAKGANKKSIIDKIDSYYSELNSFLKEVDNKVVKEEPKDIVSRINKKV